MSDKMTLQEWSNSEYIKQLQSQLTEVQEENKRYKDALEKLCEQVESWEMSVVSIIGWQPQTGMCTKDARDALNGGNVK